MTAFDIDGAHYAELRWDSAVAAWFERDGSELAALLRDSGESISPGARAFLADLVSGQVSRGKGGRPGERHGWIERAIVAEVFAEWDKAKALPANVRGEAPKHHACATVADRRAMSEDAVRGLVDKFRKLGITQERWAAWGRPDWKKNT